MNTKAKKVRTINYIDDIRFFTPNSRLKELMLLQYMEENPTTTQKEMGDIINAAPSMVNVYLNEYEEKAYIEREYLSPRKVIYRVTSEGVKRKNFLIINYLHELLKLYRLAKENVVSFFNDLASRGYRDILLYGAGEVAGTILEIVRDREFDSIRVVAIIDDEVSKREEELGYKIISRDEIDKYKHDAIVITSYTYEEEIKSRLEEINYPKENIIRFFSN
ncbi:winged helix-turn-helix domain-containing protein [Wansuia hejianensis]|nr:winged helix-turn-helix domain-containing protein [Wansuia hejianensis]